MKGPLDELQVSDGDLVKSAAVLLPAAADVAAEDPHPSERATQAPPARDPDPDGSGTIDDRTQPEPSAENTAG